MSDDVLVQFLADGQAHIAAERDALRAELEKLRGEVNAKYWEGIQADNTALRADLDALKAKPLCLCGSGYDAESELAMARASVVDLQRDLDAARKLLERWRVWWTTQDVNTVESPRRDTEVFLAQKGAGPRITPDDVRRAQRKRGG